MGYTTEFQGEFSITPALTPEHRAYLKQFAKVRHMRRDEDQLEKLPDPIREAIDYAVGPDGCYYVGDGDQFITDQNHPPATQPNLWCQWEPNEDGTALVWDGNEKFYEYDKWLEYLIEHFLRLWGYTVNGEVYWRGEECIDVGVIVVKNNSIKMVY